MIDFSFTYGGRRIFGSTLRIHSQTREKNVLVTTFYLNSLQITQRITEYGEGKESLLRFVNTGDSPTEVIADVCDADFEFAFSEDEPVLPGFVPPKDALSVWVSKGSDWSRNEFIPERKPLVYDQPQEFRCINGRSSQGVLPFFDVNRREAGALFAVGWTGQWFARFTRTKGGVRIAAGVEPLGFYLEAGESVRTASVFLFPYEQGQTKAHQTFSRTLKQIYLSSGAGEPPLFMNAWGGASTRFMREMIDKTRRERLGIEGYWIDAGWYGDYTEECPDEFVGKWGWYNGDWRVNAVAHPDGLKDVSEDARAAGMKLLLWLEPERVCEGTPLLKEHPDWCIPHISSPLHFLLDLGNPAAWDYVFELLSGLIRTLHIDWYRQDFNFDPLDQWIRTDKENRIGITQLKHIEGMYRLWEALRARFPSLGIDNCASGGRRLDWETCKRSIPLWRSDYQCSFNADGETQQNHRTGLSWWLPYHGTGTTVVPIEDEYEMRSVYSPALVLRTFGYEKVANQEQNLEKLRRFLAEYRLVRPYLSGDFQPIFGFPSEDTSWNGGHYRLTDDDAGIVLAFRRPECVCEDAAVSLEGVDREARYEFKNADTGETFLRKGSELARFVIHLKKPRSSALFFYRRTN